jgi:hypothetical protein
LKNNKTTKFWKLILLSFPVKEREHWTERHPMELASELAGAASEKL